jgi:MoxR-like ATPase
MADEINRASPRTQSALLQAMQEGRVSIAGQYHPLPRPFHVLATQNPLEQEGTYPLPEAQLDRFLLQIDVSYPDRDAERQMLIATTGITEDRPRPAMSVAELIAAQRVVRRIPVGESVVEAILSLVRSARPDGSATESMTRFVSWGPGPRADRRSVQSVDRRCARAGAASAPPSHGGQLRRPGRRRHGGSGY